jgi:hypothetical protein
VTQVNILFGKFTNLFQISDSEEGGGREIETVSKENIAHLHGLVTFIEPHKNDNTYCDSVLLIFLNTLSGDCI